MNKRDSQPRHSIAAVFVFFLLGLFAMLSLVLILFGAQAYRNTVDRTNAHNNERILNSYIRNNLAVSDSVGGIRFENGEDFQGLIISDPDDEGEFVKYIYVYDGRLCELYMETEEGFDPEAGEVICSADKIEVRSENGLADVNVVVDGMDHRTFFTLYCEEERK